MRSRSQSKKYKAGLRFAKLAAYLERSKNRNFSIFYSNAPDTLRLRSLCKPHLSKIKVSCQPENLTQFIIHALA